MFGKENGNGKLLERGLRNVALGQSSRQREHLQAGLETQLKIY